MTEPYLEILQVGAVVCSDFGPVDNVASPLGMPTHGACSVAFIVVVRTLFGRERKAAQGALEDGGRLHFDSTGACLG